MPNQPYLPKTDEEKRNWLDNFAAKKATHALTFGFTAAEVTSTQNDAKMFAYILAVLKQNKKDVKEFTAYKNILRDGPKSSPTATFPTFTAAGAVPAIVPADIFERVARDAERIKAHNNYSVALGNDFGIIGTGITFDPNQLKPVLKLEKTGTGIIIKWKKGVADALRIEVSRAAEGELWSLLAIDTEPDYLDSLGKAGHRYRAIYILNDEITGQWSAVESI